MAQDRRGTGFVIFICETIVTVSVIIATLVVILSLSFTTSRYEDRIDEGFVIFPHTHTQFRYDDVSIWRILVLASTPIHARAHLSRHYIVSLAAHPMGIHPHTIPARIPDIYPLPAVAFWFIIVILFGRFKAVGI
eukprot:471095_1